MNVVAGEVPFQYIIEDLEQASSEPAGFEVRVSAKTSAGYGRPSAALNIKVYRGQEDLAQPRRTYWL